MNDERDCLNLFISYYQKQIKNNNLKSISHSISPIYAGLKITERCNQFCKHCWSGKNVTEKSTEQILDGLEKLAYFKILHLTITGGEPLLRPDFITILKKAINLFPIIEIFTNGQNISQCLIKQLKVLLRDNDFIQISLDGLKNSYKSQRGVDSFDIVVKNVQDLLTAGIKVRLHMTVTDFNINDVISVYQLACNLKVNVFSVTPVYELRKGKNLKNLQLLEKYALTINKLKELHSQNNTETILRTFVPLEIKSKCAYYVNNINNFNFFNDNILHWTVDAAGDIYNFMDHYIHSELFIGNIYDGNIKELENRNLLIQQKIGIRNLSNCKCSHCSNIQKCKGGNYINIYPKINTADERCVFNGKKR